MQSVNGIEQGGLPANQPAGRSSAVRRSGPRYRWSSSSVGRARSLHLIFCRDPDSCSRSVPLPSVASWLDDLVPALARTPSSGWRSTANGRT
jgi:hypothetical protein